MSRLTDKAVTEASRAKPFTPPGGCYEFGDIIVAGKRRTMEVYMCLQEGPPATWSRLIGPDDPSSKEKMQHLFADALAVNDASVDSVPLTLYRHGYMVTVR